MKIKVKLTGSRNAAYYSIAAGGVVEIELEEYLRGVVAADMGNDRHNAEADGPPRAPFLTPMPNQA